MTNKSLPDDPDDYMKSLPAFLKEWKRRLLVISKFMFWWILALAFVTAVIFMFSCNPNFIGNGTGDALPDAAVPDSGTDAAVDSGQETDPDCPNSSYPEDCEDGDGYCWPPEVDCDTTLFTCGTSSVSRCIDSTAYAACCDGDFFVCGIAYPWYCFADGHCHRTEEDCLTAPDAGYVCDFRGVPCS